MLVSMSPSEEKKFQSLLTFCGGGAGQKKQQGKTAAEGDFLPF